MDDDDPIADTVWHLRLKMMLDRAMCLGWLPAGELAEVGRAAMEGFDPEERDRLVAALDDPSTQDTGSLRDNVLSIFEVVAYRLQAEAAARQLIDPPETH